MNQIKKKSPLITTIGTLILLNYYVHMQSINYVSLLEIGAQCIYSPLIVFEISEMFVIILNTNLKLR